VTADLSLLAGVRVIPVIEIPDSAAAVPLAEALAEGGIPVAEITLRTADALRSIELIRAAVPGFQVGAGSLLNAAQLRRASEAGATFGVSPGLTPQLVAAARETALPFIPGIASLSEVLQGLELGVERFKFFPAGSLGGAATLKAFSAPLATSPAAFMPTGGVNLDNLAAYLALPKVFAVGGSWIATREQIAEGDFAGIADRARRAVAFAADAATT
jgi:2-dehydro-3-deoxyphosphogluconate aldolase/(4S)-4-hydroxy-2-oxoglutarate aldolase